MNELLTAYGKLTRGEIKAINDAAGKDIFASIEPNKVIYKTYFELRAMSRKALDDFLSDFNADNIIGMTTNNFYSMYIEYCETNEVDPISNIEFSKCVKSEFNVDIISKKINGVCRRVFVR